ncbi:MAG: PGPGW domain-containing protein [Microthrixaceae bacterium]
MKGVDPQASAGEEVGDTPGDATRAPDADAPPAPAPPAPASDPVVRMFRRPRRPRFRRSSDVLIEPKERGRLRAAALAAELATGKHEESELEAQRGVLVRLTRMSLGAIVMLAGLVMLVIPGPGWLAIAAGLAILSKDVAWADNALRFIREKIPGVPADGKIPRSTWLVIGFLGAAGLAVGLAYATNGM